MSLITRCPACQTMFKVVPDQLRISEGWVRCGQCAEIFNAAQNMVSTDNAPLAQPVAPPSPPALAPVREPVPEPAKPLPPQQPASLEPEDPLAKPASATTDGTALPAQTWQAPDGVTRVAQQPTTPAPVDLDPFQNGPAPREPAWQETPGTGAEPEPALTQTSVRRDAALDDPLHVDAPHPSFLRADEDSFWQRRSVRWVLLLLAVGLAAALVMQVTVQERNRIVQIEPGTRSLLVALCAVAHCDIGPLQQIDSIVIDGSSFGRVRGDNYRLNFSLRNTAPIDVAMPAIELSLTDTQDQALVRRVILPAEFGAPTPALAAGADWSTNLSLAIRAAPTTERITGYRLLAFYP